MCQPRPISTIYVVETINLLWSQLSIRPWGVSTYWDTVKQPDIVVGPSNGTDARTVKALGTTNSINSIGVYRAEEDVSRT